MKTEKVQWLQSMGIEVWRLRGTAEATPSTIVPEMEEPVRIDLEESETHKAVEKSGARPEQSTDDKTELSSTKSTVPNVSDRPVHREIRFEVRCRMREGLLLVKDGEAFDRDFSDDIFRAFYVSHNKAAQVSDEGFFEFRWPPTSRILSAPTSDDDTLKSVQQSFLAMARSYDQVTVTHVLRIGKNAIRLLDENLFQGARVWTYPDDQISAEFKQSLWEFFSK